jgi:hypothetical protein
MQYEAHLFDRDGDFVAELHFERDSNRYAPEYIIYEKNIYVINYEQTWVDDDYITVCNFYLGDGENFDD